VRVLRRAVRGSGDGSVLLGSLPSVGAAWPVRGEGGVSRLGVWVASVRRYGVWPRARRRRISAEWDRNRVLREVIVSVATLVRDSSFGKDEVDLLRAWIRELELDASEANAVVQQVVWYSTLTQPEVQEHVMFHRQREEGLR
jgi:hypothetical protein